MADSKISQLGAGGGAALTTDEVPARRGAGNVKLTVAELHTVGGQGASGSWRTVSGGGSPISTRYSFGTDGTGWQHTIAKNQGGSLTDLVSVKDNGDVGLVAGGKLILTAGFNPYGLGLFNIGGLGDAVVGLFTSASYGGAAMAFGKSTGGTNFTAFMNLLTDGKVGIGMVPTALLELSSDSAKKPSTNTWTVASDARLKDNIVAADLARCYEIVKGLPLRRYTWKDTVYDSDRVADRSKLGWIAQEVRNVLPKSVTAGTFALRPVAEGQEEVEEQVTFEEVVTRKSIEMVDGAAVLREVTESVQVPQFDLVPVVDAEGAAVLVDVDEQGEKLPEPVPLVHRVPRMRKVARPRSRIETIDDCLSFNADQIYAVMYGAVQALMAKVEALEAKLAAKKA